MLKDVQVDEKIGVWSLGALGGSEGDADGSPVEVHQVFRSFSNGEGGEFFALRDVSLRVAAGTSLALVGPSGSGKSTLLNLVAGLDRPSAGHLRIAGLELTGKSEDQLAHHRGRNVGVVFQFFQLLPTLTALENVVLPMQLVGAIPKELRRERALSLLERFKIADQAHKLPFTLSGGQQQRLAIARALANDPALIVADEPTGNLDTRMADQTLELLLGLTQSQKCVIMATHETRFLPSFDRVVTLADGEVLSDSERAESGPAVLDQGVSCSP